MSALIEQGDPFATIVERASEIAQGSDARVLGCENNRVFIAGNHHAIARLQDEVDREDEIDAVHGPIPHVDREGPVI